MAGAAEERCHEKTAVEAGTKASGLRGSRTLIGAAKSAGEEEGWRRLALVGSKKKK